MLSRSEAIRLSSAPWQCTLDVPASFAGQMHLDNVQIASLFNQARLLFQDHLLEGLTPLPGFANVIAKIIIDFKAELIYVPAVFIDAAIEQIGSSSWTVVLGLYERDRLIARCETVNVWISGARPTKPPEYLVAKMRENLRNSAGGDAPFGDQSHKND